MNKIDIKNYSKESDLITAIRSELDSAELPDITKFSKWDRFCEFMDTIEPGSVVACYGDYDFDGLMSLLITVNAVEALGAKSRPYKYKIRTHALDSLFVPFVMQTNATHCIICDTGSSSSDKQQEAYLESLGKKVLVIDHHICSNYTHEKNIMNCESEGDEFNCLSAGGFSWLLFYNYLKKREIDFDPCNLLYAYMAIVADIMDLSNNTNIAISRLAHRIPRSSWPLTIQRLAEYLKNGGITARAVGFVIAPTINACFRSGAVNLINEAFISKKGNANDRLVAIDKMIEMREENSAMLTVIENMAKPVECDNLVLLDISQIEGLLSIADVDFTEYTGLIANKLLSKYGKSAVVYGVGSNEGKGSVRSLPGAGLFPYLEIFTRCGGHPDAFGFHFSPVDKDNITQNLIELDKVVKMAGNSDSLFQNVVTFPVTYEGYYNIAMYNECVRDGGDKIYVRKYLGTCDRVKQYGDKVYHYEGKLKYIGDSNCGYMPVIVTPTLSNGSINCYIEEICNGN